MARGPRLRGARRGRARRRRGPRRGWRACHRGTETGLFARSLSSGDRQAGADRSGLACRATARQTCAARQRQARAAAGARCPVRPPARRFRGGTGVPGPLRAPQIGEETRPARQGVRPAARRSERRWRHTAWHRHRLPRGRDPLRPVPCCAWPEPGRQGRRMGRSTAGHPHHGRQSLWLVHPDRSRHLRADGGRAARPCRLRRSRDLRIRAGGRSPSPRPPAGPAPLPHRAYGPRLPRRTRAHASRRPRG
mgnify:CR=1 FL=1